ncbi:D-glycero-beta-D-manno-heptose-7-phosphate kinase [Desulfovibrio oxyclinae]|uniref:D-glycero-beta-D-manno-heptose-7-phosphate kinase n=1 Tax=Desulfovibrio oxyclinae TaxID=63560 RepID=UPI00039ACD14|nr:D-glycero-beta-D-manno-heptose-7-phosphate kinase [Desulfovibrio oxyclinae]
MRDELKQLLGKVAGRRVLIIGDLMLDHYLTGSVERISPEAPVPVVRVEKETHVLGGAGNVARNIAELGGQPVLAGMRGKDIHGDTLTRLCNEHGLETRLVVSETRPTTIKTRVLASNQQIVRVDHEELGNPTGPELDELFADIEEDLENTPVIILSDYGKGLVCREFMDRLWSALESLENRPMVLVDPKTVNYDFYQGVDLLTPNTKEAGEGAGMHVSGRDEAVEAGRRLFDRLGCRHLLVTLGRDGMALFHDRENVHHIPTFARNVFDVTGAGDTVIATLALGLAAGGGLVASATLANHAAGIVVSRIGAATATPGQIMESIDGLPEIESERI